MRAAPTPRTVALTETRPTSTPPGPSGPLKASSSAAVEGFGSDLSAETIEIKYNQDLAAREIGKLELNLDLAARENGRPK